MATARRRNEWRQIAFLLKKIDDAWFKRSERTTAVDFDPTATAEERREARRPKIFISFEDAGAALGLQIVKADSKKGNEDDEREQH